MKEFQDLLALANSEKTKESAVLGAGVGALLGLGTGETLKNALVGAAAGAALSWVASQYFTDKTKPVSTSTELKDEDVKPASE